MNELTQAYFDYAVLPIDAALTARAAAERIKLRLKRTVEDLSLIHIFGAALVGNGR